MLITIAIHAKNCFRLHPIKSGEQEQLNQLARLYSLNVHHSQNGPDCSCPVLTKTRHTMRVMPGSSQHASRGHPLSDYKRRRRCPLPSTSGLTQPIPILKATLENPHPLTVEVASSSGTTPVTESINID